MFQKFREFEVLVTNERGLKIKVLRTDGGGEYVPATFKIFLKQKKFDMKSAHHTCILCNRMESWKERTEHF